MNSTDRYKEIRELGKGAFKEVTLCFDSKTEREVALARPVLNEERFYESFLREARINALLDHPNIVPVYDTGVDATNTPFFVMKVLDGETFSETLRKAKRDDRYCTLRNRLEVFLKVCDAMSHAHNKGIQHLDLKPENFQVNEYGAVHICDWGLAGVKDKENYEVFDYYDDNFRTLSGEVKGTPGYMAPEQASGETGTKDNRTDIFALGAVLYEILCFNVPFSGRDIREVIVTTCLAEAALPSQQRPDLDIPEGIEAVAMKAISKEPEDRYQTVDELKLEVEAFLHGFATEAENAGFSKLLKLLYQRNMTFFNSCGFILLTIIILSSVFYQNLEAKNNERQYAIDHFKKQEADLKANLKRLTDERQMNKKISPLTAKNYEMEAHRALIHQHDLELAEKHCLTALLLNPNAELAKVIRARVEFIRQNYEKSLKIYKELDLMEREDAIAGLALQGKKRNIKEVYFHTKDMSQRHAGKTIKLCSWQFAIFRQSDLNKIANDLSWLLSQLHSGSQIMCKAYKTKDGLGIDFSGQKELVDISSLKATVISEINLTGTSISDFEVLRQIPSLKTLRIEKGRLDKRMQNYLSHLQINYNEPKFNNK